MAPLTSNMVGLFLLLRRFVSLRRRRRRWGPLRSVPFRSLPDCRRVRAVFVGTELFGGKKGPLWLRGLVQIAQAHQICTDHVVGGDGRRRGCGGSVDC